MPPIIKTTKNDILNMAYQIVKEEGIEKLNARYLAKKLNCSIQPIFHNYKNMEELKDEVFKKAYNTYISYVDKETSKDAIKYKGIGKGYIKFARDDSNLFKFVFMKDYRTNIKSVFEHAGESSEIIKAIQKLTGFTEEDAKSFHLKIWIFTHGMATMVMTHTCEFSDDEIDKMLSDTFNAFFEQVKEK